MKKENFIIVGITLIIVTISVSLAYFAAKIVGTPKDVSLSMKGLYVEFTDNTAELNASGITPGWTYEKTFTIENKSESDYKYNIIIKDLVNTFVTDNLQYKITNTSGNGGYSMSDFESIPKSETKKEEILAYSVSISSGVKQVYKLELRYLDSDEQNSDMGKKFSGKLFIAEGTEGSLSLATLIQANTVNEDGYRYEGSDPNNYIQMQKTDGTTEIWRIIGLFPDGENGEDIIRVRKVEYESASYDSNSTNHWPNTTLYSTLSSTYSLANYKNTVNYKIYLGTSSVFESYTSSNLYDMERMLNNMGTVGASSSGNVLFTGSVGLMYPSDYGYGVLASDCARTIKLTNYMSTVACHDNNWLYQGSSNFQWLISPMSSDTNIVFVVNSDFINDVTETGLFSPVMALKSDVTVTGSGTQTDPYVMN